MGTLFGKAGSFFNNIRDSKPIQIIRKPFTLVSSLLRLINIRTRLIASLLLISLLPLVITGISTFRKSSQAISGKIENYSNELMTQLGNNINNTIDLTESKALEIAISDLIQKNVPNYKNMEAYDLMTFHNDFGTAMVNKCATSDNIKSIKIIIDPETVISHGQSPFSYTEDMFRKLINIGSDSDGNAVWRLAKDPENNPIPYLEIIRNITPIQYAKNDFGTLSMLISNDIFVDIYKDINLGKGADICIIDGNNTIISSTEKELTGKPFTNENIIKEIVYNSNNNKSYFDFTMNNEKYLVSYIPVKHTDWYAVSTIPYSYINSASTSIRNRVQYLCIIFAVIALILSYILSLSISTPLKKLVYLMEEAKNGNLSVKVTDKSRDQIAIVITNFNEMVKNIGLLISQVKESSQYVLNSSTQLAASSDQSYTASEQIAETIQQIAEGASSQAEGVTESVNHMSLLSNGITQVNNDVNEVSKVVNETQKLSENALVTVKSLNDTADENRSASENIVNDINSLNEDMKEIQKIIKVIVNIAEQTNLLSLNAAIEAARAGEAGKGFAVVAGEVRKLADMAKESTITIGNIVNNIQKKTEVTVEAANKTTSAVEDQMKAVKETDESFRTIYNAMDGITTQIESMNNSVNEIIKSKEQTQESIEGISAVSEESASTAEEVSASTEEMMAGSESLAQLAKQLSKMAEDLSETIKNFKLEE